MTVFTGTRARALALYAVIKQGEKLDAAQRRTGFSLLGTVVEEETCDRGDP